MNPSVSYQRSTTTSIAIGRSLALFGTKNKMTLNLTLIASLLSMQTVIVLRHASPPCGENACEISCGHWTPGLFVTLSSAHPSLGVRVCISLFHLPQIILSYPPVERKKTVRKCMQDSAYSKGAGFSEEFNSKRNKARLDKRVIAEQSNETQDAATVPKNRRTTAVPTCSPEK